MTAPTKKKPDPRKGRAGRKTKHTPPTVDRLLKAAKQGLTQDGCAHYAGIHPSTLYEWLNTRPEFREAFTRARGEGQMRLVKDVVKRNPEFILERSFGYVKRDAVEVSGRGADGAIEVRMWQPPTTKTRKDDDTEEGGGPDDE